MAILVVHETGSKAEMQKSCFNKKAKHALTPSVLPTRFDHKFASLTTQVVLKTIYDRPFLLSTQVVGVIEVVPHENVTKAPACTTAKGIVDVYQRPPVYVTIANASQAHDNLPRHRKKGDVFNNKKWSILKTSVSHTPLTKKRVNVTA